jgi:hypothetical protein
MSSSPITSTTRKVFYQEWRVPIVIIALIFMGILVESWATYGLNFGVMMLIFINFWYARDLLCNALYGRVVVTAEGVEARRVGYGIHTTWNNIECMTYAQIDSARGDVLVLREPNVKVNRWPTWLTNETRWLERNREFAPLGKVIPLFLLDPKWRTGALGQDLRRHVPNLFVEYEK